MSENEETVFVVEDDPSVSRAVTRLLKSAGHRVETFACAEDFLDSESTRKSGCVVLDVCMPGISGLELQQEFCKRGVTTPVVFITGHGDIPMSVQAMKNGAVDFLTKPFSDESLLNAVQQGFERARVLISKSEKSIDLKRRFNSLTLRERDVWALVTSGKPNKQVAHELGISEKTVKIHRGRVMTKMKASSFAELVRFSEELEV